MMINAYCVDEQKKVLIHPFQTSNFTFPFFFYLPSTQQRIKLSKKKLKF